MKTPPFLHRRRLARECFSLVGFLLLAARAVAGDPIYPGREWESVPPDQAKVLEGRLAEARAYSEQLGSTSAMIVQHGLVVAAWGDVAHRSNLHSVRKSLLNALIGIAINNGKMNLQDTLEKLQIDDVEPVLTDEEKKATVGDLLKARSGIYHPAVYETDAMKKKRPARGSHLPGAFWYYNNWDFNTLGAIYEKATGQSIFEAFKQQIADPIGMQDYDLAANKYYREDESRYPAYLINMSTRDLARFALLYLRGGRWQNIQIVPAQWVKDSTAPYSVTDSSTGGGYGYLWWTSDTPTGAVGPFHPGAYWAAGNYGQFAIVIPALDLIIVNRVDHALTDKEVKRKDMIRLSGLIIQALEGSSVLSQ